MSNVTRKFVMAAAGVMMSATAAAAQTSQLNISGSADFYQTAPGAANNLVIDFQPGGLPTGNVTTCCGFPTDQTGIFAAIPNGTVGQQTDLVFGPAGAPAPTNPPFTLLVIGGYTFQATAFAAGNTGTPVSLQQLGNSTFAFVTVTGTVTGPGAFMGNFTGAYSTQFPDITPAALTAAIENNQTFNKTVSATFTVTPTSTVPEPSTYMLLATGIGALGMVARRRRTTV